jgi:uncharacterized protein YxjI
MRYVMKQELFSWGDDFFIKDESGRDAFFVDGKAFSFGNQLSFQDLTGNELAFIKQRLLSWGPTYEIYRGGQLYAVADTYGVDIVDGEDDVTILASTVVIDMACHEDKG